MDTLEQYRVFHKHTTHNWLVKDMWERDALVIDLRAQLAKAEGKLTEIRTYIDRYLDDGVVLGYDTALEDDNMAWWMEGR